MRGGLRGPETRLQMPLQLLTLPWSPQGFKIRHLSHVWSSMLLGNPSLLAQTRDIGAELEHKPEI